MAALPDAVLQATLRLALALLLLGAARQKLADFARFEAVVANYRLLPRRAARATAAAVTAVEVAIGVALLLPARAAAGAWGAATLLLIYSAAIALNLRRGRVAIDCGCGGPGRARPLSARLLLRNGALVLAACAAALPAPPRPFVWIDALTIAAGVATLSLLYAAVDATLAVAGGHALRGRA